MPRQLGRRPTPSLNIRLEVLDEHNVRSVGLEPRARWHGRHAHAHPNRRTRASSAHRSCLDPRLSCRGECRGGPAGRGRPPPELAASRARARTWLRRCHGVPSRARRSGIARRSWRDVVRAVGMRAKTAGRAAAAPLGAERERRDVPVASVPTFRGSRARDPERARSACHGRPYRSQSCTIDVLYQYAVMCTRGARKRVFA